MLSRHSGVQCMTIVSPPSIRHKTNLWPTELDLGNEFDHRIVRGVLRIFVMSVACRQGRLTPPYIWFRTIWNLHNSLSLKPVFPNFMFSCILINTSCNSTTVLEYNLAWRYITIKNYVLYVFFVFFASCGINIKTYRFCTFLVLHQNIKRF